MKGPTMSAWTLHWNVKLPAGPLLKVILPEHGPLHVFVWATPGRLTPKSCGTDVSLFVKFTVTCVFAGTVMLWRLNTRFVAVIARLTGAPADGGGAGAVVGAGAGGAGGVVACGGGGGCVGGNGASVAGACVGASVAAGAAVAVAAAADVVAGGAAAVVPACVEAGAEVAEGGSPSEPLQPAASRAATSKDVSSLTMIVTGEEVSLLP